MLICIRLIVDDRVLFVHTAGLNHTKSGQCRCNPHVNLCFGRKSGLRAGRCSRTCSMSSQSSLPTKIISLGRRCRVPPLLTRNQEVRLISASGGAHLWPLTHPAGNRDTDADDFSMSPLNDSTLHSGQDNLIHSWFTPGDNFYLHDCGVFSEFRGDWHFLLSSSRRDEAALRSLTFNTMACIPSKRLILNCSAEVPGCQIQQSPQKKKPHTHTEEESDTKKRG